MPHELFMDELNDLIQSYQARPAGSFGYTTKILMQARAGLTTMAGQIEQQAQEIERLQRDNSDYRDRLDRGRNVPR